MNDYSEMTVDEQLHWEASPACFHYGMWFGNLYLNGEPRADILVKAFRYTDREQRWFIVMRLRVYRSERVFDSDDEKHWRMVECHGGEGGVLKVVDSLIKHFAPVGEFPGSQPVVFDFMELQCTGDKLGEKVMAAKRPWMHFKQISKEEYDALKSKS